MDNKKEKRIVENLKYWKLNGFNRDESVKNVIAAFPEFDADEINRLSGNLFVKRIVNSHVLYSEKPEHTVKKSRNGKKYMISFAIMLSVLCVIAFCFISINADSGVDEEDSEYSVSYEVNFGGKKFTVKYYQYDFDESLIESYPHVAIRIGNEREEGIRRIENIEIYYENEEKPDTDINRFIRYLDSKNDLEFNYGIEKIKSYATAISSAVSQYREYEKEFPDMEDIKRIYITQNSGDELSEYCLIRNTDYVVYTGFDKELISMLNGKGSDIVMSDRISFIGGKKTTAESIPTNDTDYERVVFPVFSLKTE